MSGVLALSSPWARQAVRDQAERDAIAARIPDGYAVGVAVNSNNSAYRAWVLQLGESLSKNEVLHDDRVYHRDVHTAIDRAIAWIETQQLVEAH